MDEKLLWISKRLADIAKDIEGLREDEKKYIIERAEQLSPISLIESYNALGEYGEL